jgi:hypothetical protein
MSPRGPSVGLRPYYASKWKCPVHGYYAARTEHPVDPEKRPVICPECIASIEMISQLKGHTSQSVPFVSKPRIPKKTDLSRTYSEKAPLRKRGISW